jgi:parallel beta-helix repeat protein
MMARLYVAAMVITMCGLANAATINVPGDYTQIQAAVDAASNGDEILVEPGTYTGSGNEVVNMLGKAITLRASGTPEQTIIDGEGVRRVLQCSTNEGAGTIIEGFTITGGSGGNGGGIACVESSPMIINCTITGNTASGTSPPRGGGIYCYGNSSSPTISGCTISGNTSGNRGGGIACDNDSSPTITGCTISGNTAAVGGGIVCDDGSNPTITGCTISDNNTGSHGAGIFCFESSPTITDCTISSNTAAEGDGGGIWLRSYSSPTITDCTISGNTATNKGGGIWCYELSSPTITDCTISNNTADNGGGGIYFGADNPTLLNSAVCGNSPNQIEGAYIDEGGNTVAAVCPIPGACCTNGACVIAEQDDCLAFYGQWLGEGTTCADSPCPIACLGDVTGDGQVSVNDVLTVIGNWGPCP